MGAPLNIGVAGCGALGGAVARAILQGIDGLTLKGVCDLPRPAIDAPFMTFDELSMACDVVVECLPAAAVPGLARPLLTQGKVLVMLTSSAALLYPEILDLARKAAGRIIVPSGALAGLDAVSALAIKGIESAVITSTKPPKGLAGAPFLQKAGIDVLSFKEKTRVFSGHALEAARAFPANVNVAASLTLASALPPERVMVEVFADPAARGNRHDIKVSGGGSTVSASIENTPDPANPKSSLLAAYSVLHTLRRMTGSIVAG